MKNGVVALSLMAFAGGAYAQTSVTLYGRIDNGLTYRTGQPGGSLFGMESGGYGESWWGLEGSEDLGAGTKATFELESGINTANGSINNGGLFARHALVGLSNSTYGTFKLGNIGAWWMSQDNWYVDPQLRSAYSVWNLDRGRSSAQAGNGAQYTSPSLGGLTLKAQYALTNSPGNWNGCSGNNCGSQPSNDGNAQGRAAGIEARYVTNNFELLALYDEIRDTNGQFTSVYAASRELTIGGTVTWGPLKAYIGYQLLRAPDATLGNQGLTTGTVTGTLPSGITGAPTTVNHEWIGLNYTPSPDVVVTGGIYHANANNGNGNATLYTLGGSYLLSKRTFLYTEVGYVTNSATSNLGLAGTAYYGPNTTQGGASTTSPNYGRNQFGAVGGIMHLF
jgi:predicted porin